MGRLTKNWSRFCLSTVAFAASLSAQAAAPQGLTFQGRIIKPDGRPLEASSVALNVRILSPTSDCILLEENHMVSMAGSSGVFSLNI
ncbi:MAG: hypothetical protein AB7O96_18145, partial [Pseudobdellovibrionaceae bacterium]